MEKEEELFNHTGNSFDCKVSPIHYAAFSLIDIITFLVGQPVSAKLLWLVITSKRTMDILNCNLALFHNLQYSVSILHLICLFLWPEIHLLIIKFLLVYVEVGGPMSLTFICLERFFAVIYPTSYPLLRKYRCREICAASVWLMSLSTAFLTVFVKETISSRAMSVIKTAPVFVMVFMMNIMLSCSISIARELRRSGPAGKKDALHPVKKRALRTVYAIMFITVLCYSPVSVLQRMMYQNERLYDCLTTPLCILLLSLASVVHPLFYLSTQGKLCACSEKGKKIT